MIVGLDADASPQLRESGSRRSIQRVRERLLEELGPGELHERIRSFQTLPFVALEVDPEFLARLERSSWVVSIAEDQLLAPALASSVPAIGADQAHAQGFDGSGWAVAVLDTGVDAGHPFLADRVIAEAEACFSANGDCPGGGTTELGPGAGTHCRYASSCYHGTHVAGIAAGDSDRYRGTAPGASVIPVQVFSRFSGVICESQREDPCAMAYMSDVLAGLEHVHELRGAYAIASVNLSLSGGAFSSQLFCDAAHRATKAAIDNLRAAGIATVVASGNGGSGGALGSPACISSAVSVGATHDDGPVASFSNSAPFLSLLAPGVGVTSSIPPDLWGAEWGRASGTSMATPHVSGAWALIRQSAPLATVDQALSALQLTGVPVTDSRNGVTTPRIEALRGIEQLALPTCSNGIDDDGDGAVDFPEDIGCRDEFFFFENPQCDDGVDNDDDGLVDWDGSPPDPQCTAPWRRERRQACGLGFELLLGLPAWLWLRRRRALRPRSS